MASLTNHEVIDDGDIQKASCRYHIGGERDIGAGWRRIAGWVVMHEHDRYSIMSHRVAKQFPDANGGLVRTSLIDRPYRQHDVSAIHPSNPSS